MTNNKQGRNNNIYNNNNNNNNNNKYNNNNNINNKLRLISDKLMANLNLPGFEFIKIYAQARAH